MAELGAQEVMAVQGAQEAMAGGPCGRGLGPLGPAPTAGTLSPPQKISLGKLGGIRSPPGLDTDKQDRTSHRNRFHLHVLSTETRPGQAAPLVVAMEAILAACPRRVSVDKT